MSAENRGTGQLSCNWVLGIQGGCRTMSNCPVPLFYGFEGFNSDPGPVEPEGSKLELRS